MRILIMLLLAGCAGHSAAAATPPERPEASVESVSPTGAQPGHRIYGDPQVQLPLASVERFYQHHVGKVQARIELCLSIEGVPVRATFRQSTGDAQADLAIGKAMGKWRYQPATLDGRAIPVCFTVVFNYTFK